MVDTPTRGEWQRSVEELKNRLGGNDPLSRKWRWIKFAVVAAVIVIALLVASAGWIQKDLWMRQLGYVNVFWTIMSMRWGLFCAAFLITFFYLWINVRVARKNSEVLHLAGLTADLPLGAEERPRVSPSELAPALTLLAGAGAVMLALIFYGQWDTYLRFHYGGSFGLSDPLYGIDTGFYIFRLPFYQLLQGSLTMLSIVTLLGALAFYGHYGLMRFAREGHLDLKGTKAIPHLCILLLVLVASWGWGFYLDHYQLVYSTQGVVYGAGYTADHVTRIAYWVMVGASVALCVLLALSALKVRIKAVAIGSGIYVLLYILGVLLAPNLFQRFVVQPNELAMETPFLKHNIDFTRKAFGLDKIQETFYPALTDLTAQMIDRNEDTIQNIRLWDWRPLLETYKQAQEIRLYYKFYNADVGRYHLSDGYHQVTVSVRELASELPAKAQTWVNQKLQFTHGFGLVMSFVSKTMGGGFPQYLISNIPPQSSFGLKITQPAVYYGQMMPGYRIVSTGVKEFDYPRGNENVYTSYHGTGGIPIDSFWKRVLFAWTQGDLNILLTSYLTPQSRIQLWRRVHDRVEQVAPFLRLDSDPYPVVSDGRLYWIQDAYTVSDHFPYSTPYAVNFESGLNYIRNSVKVVVDMYNGTVNFYVMDPRDPVLAAYRRAFPGLFKSLDQLSPDLKEHLRYPEDLFSIQADMYRTFHMTDPQVFYNREDLWVLPKEQYGGALLPMRPYYILMKLPGSSRLEYLLMASFTPQNRNNMISWMAAKCDFPDYGKILVYRLPKDKLILGPMQIQAMIDQKTTISQQLSLWDQKGSKVIRGNLISVPIENSFLYVVPVYLTAAGTNFPQLKRVIVVSGDKVAMEPTLNEAIQAVFGKGKPAVASVQPAVQERPEWGRAKQQFDQAQKAMQQGDWASFGKAMDALKHLLTRPAR